MIYKREEPFEFIFLQPSQDQEFKHEPPTPNSNSDLHNTCTPSVHVIWKVMSITIH